jgi:hypothetical protein
VDYEIAPSWILGRQNLDQRAPPWKAIASEAKEMIAGVATSINEKGAFGADGAPTEIRAPTKHARPVVNEPLLNTPCARHAVFIRYTTPKGTGSGGKGTGSVGTEFWMGFVAAVGNPSRRNHRDGHAPAAVGAEARRVERAPAARTVGRDSTAARAVGVGEWRGHVRRIVRSLFWWHRVWRLRSQR